MPSTRGISWCWDEEGRAYEVREGDTLSTGSLRTGSGAAWGRSCGAPRLSPLKSIFVNQMPSIPETGWCSNV
ncbi:hypothetical protein CLOM_g14335 [Closterium sp. NIES-68]|nr:hypothetical protein CLOM_g14335 [Closterium sp. NIES-68]